MKDRSPCISCKHRSPGCQSRCEIGRAYFKRQAEERERIRTEQRKESDFSTYKFERIQDTMKKAGMMGR